MFGTLTILPGINKQGEPESFARIDITAGDTLSVVGHTGSGKTALISDIEILAQGDSATKRRILLDGEVPTKEVRYDLTLKPVTMITQSTKCFTDLPVSEFLKVHCRARGTDESIVPETVDLANEFTGEKISLTDRVTTLSGGQTRSLMIADALLIGAAPIILLDEIENAGIHRSNVMDVIVKNQRVVVFVTHDPSIALSTPRRIIMSEGAVTKVIHQDAGDWKLAKKLATHTAKIDKIRDIVRSGGVLRGDEL